MFGSFGWQEMLLVFLIALILFGARRLPEIGRSLGQAMREFKRTISGLSDEEDSGKSAREGESNRN
jgi:sec-independent protein translocase protein TatA